MITVIVCADNEERTLPACLHSLLAQTRPPDELLVINNASTDETGAMARQLANVRVVDEPRKGLVVARETGRVEARANLLVYVDADCRPPLTWLERIERHFDRDPDLVANLLAAGAGGERGVGGTGTPSRVTQPRTCRCRPPGQARGSLPVSSRTATCF